jgi:hypothetical protein
MKLSSELLYNIITISEFKIRQFGAGGVCLGKRSPPPICRKLSIKTDEFWKFEELAPVAKVPFGETHYR